MRQRFWACSCLIGWVIVGCQDQPSAAPSAPPVQTEVIKYRDGRVKTIQTEVVQQPDGSVVTVKTETIELPDGSVETRTVMPD